MCMLRAGVYMYIYTVFVYMYICTPTLEHIAGQAAASASAAAPAAMPAEEGQARSALILFQ